VEGEVFPLFIMVRELIYDPDAKRGTSSDSAKAAGRNLVTPCFTRFASEPKYGLHVMRPLEYSRYAGFSVFVPAPSVLVRVGLAMNSRTLLQPATVELLQTSQRLASGEEAGYGLGWDLETVALAAKQTRVIGYNGFLMGGWQRLC
jgi:hypothetical protein